jgi:hypothetical protein
MEHDETLSDQSPGFECLVVGIDEAEFKILRHWGEVVYVRVLRGVLPSRLSNVLVNSESRGYYRWLFGRPRKGEFTPTPVTLVMPSRRAYRLTLLAALPSLADLRPYLRSGLRPPDDLDPRAVPVAIESFAPYVNTFANRFRPLDGHLFGGWEPIKGAEVQREGIPWDRVWAMRALDGRSDAAAITTLIEALHDEIELVRGIAAYSLTPYARRLPIEPFLALARDTSVLNEDACRVAAAVFGAHADVVPLETVIDLYRDAPDEWTAAAAVWAMGQYGDRSPVDLLGRMLLVYFEVGPHEYRFMNSGAVRREAARTLRELGGLAPINALVAGLYDMETALDAALALLAHPGPVPEDIRRAAEAIANGEKRYLQSRF